MTWAVAFLFYLGVVAVVVGLCRAAGADRPRRKGMFLEDEHADATRELGPPSPELARLNDHDGEAYERSLQATVDPPRDGLADDISAALEAERQREDDAARRRTFDSGAAWRHRDERDAEQMRTGGEWSL